VSEQRRKEIKIQIQLDEETAQGVYSNLAVVNHSDAEFTLDFIFVQPQAPRAKVRSRIITSPKHARRLIAALEDNVRKYEQKYGPVDEGPKTAAPEVGDYH